MCGNQNDPFVTYLKSFGYNPIRMPRTDIRPLQLMVKEGKDLVFLGEVPEVFSSNISLPEIQANNLAASISGQRTGDLSIGVALSLLGNVISALGGPKLGLDVAYKTARTAVFEFPEVFEDRVSIAKLDQYLSTSDVNPNSTGVGKMLEADDVYITTSCIKSKKFTLDASSSSGTTVGVDVPVLSQVVGTSIKVSSDTDMKGKVTFEGATPIVFGFQAVRLYFDSGRYTAIKPVEGVVAKALENRLPNDGGTRFITEGAFASVRL